MPHKKQPILPHPCRPYAAASLVKKEAEEKRTALIDALAKKAIALLEREELLTPVITSAPSAPSPNAKPAAGVAAAVAEIPLVVAEAEFEGSEAESSTPVPESSDKATAVEVPAHVAGGGAAAVAEAAAAAAGAEVAGADKADVAVAAAVVAPAVDVVMAALNELRRYVDTSSEVPHLMLHSRMEARAKRWVLRFVSSCHERNSAVASPQPCAVPSLVPCEWPTRPSVSHVEQPSNINPM